MTGWAPVQQRLPSLLDPPIAFAHRGARAHARENTMEAFELAIRLGATGLESDVWLTADGVAVLDHDGLVGSRLRRRPIAEALYADLPAHIPRLEDLLVTDGLKRHLSLDLKDPRAGEEVISTCSRIAPSHLDRLWLCHPDLDVLRGLRSDHPEVRLVHSTKLAMLDHGPERHAAELSGAGVDVINLHQRDWSGGLVALFHRFGVLAFGWDMQFEHVLRPALRMGLDGVFSDHVDVMVDAFRLEIGSTPAG